MILHVTCLNLGLILNLLPSCGNINFALVVLVVERGSSPLELVVVRNCCMARMLPGEAGLVLE